MRVLPGLGMVMLLAAAACSASDSDEATGEESIVAASSSKTLTFDFSNGDAHGFIPVFRDLPEDIYNEYVAHASSGTLGPVAPLSNGVGTYPEDETHWLLNAGIYPMPNGIPGKGLLVQGNNHSDDLDMHIVRKLGPKDGLRPKGRYTFHVSVDRATNAVVGSYGIGGGETLKLTAGVQNTDPTQYHVDENNHVRANPAPEVTNESVGGIGTNGACYHRTVSYLPPGEIRCPAAPIPFAMRKQLQPADIGVVADDRGEVWLMIGGHSGFESFSAIYYSKVTVDVVPVP